MLSNVTIEIADGETLGLIGPNGAGKSTLLKVIMGFLRPSRGRIFLDKKEITGLAPHAVGRLGLAHTFQLVKIFPQMNVLENVMVAMPETPGDGFWAGLFHTGSMKKSMQAKRDKAVKYLNLMGLDTRMDILANDLSYGQKKRLEMARALAQEPRLLLLDEPTAGVDQAVITDMLNIISRIQENGITILMVEHNMEAVRRVCHRVVALDLGRVIAEGPPEEVFSHEAVIEAYLG